MLFAFKPVTVAVLCITVVLLSVVPVAKVETVDASKRYLLASGVPPETHCAVTEEFPTYKNVDTAVTGANANVLVASSSK